MKKLLHAFIGAGCLLSASTTFAQTRYLDDMFNDADIEITSNVEYGKNKNFNAQQQIFTQPLMMDVYQPKQSVDTETDRRLIIFFHTGSFLPPGLNGGALGHKEEKAIVELCKRFAKKGYVTVSASYRIGWNPQATKLDVRRGTNLLAVYKAIQDAKACVRFFRKDAKDGGDNYKLDQSKIALFGSGSGGYITFGYATLDKAADVLDVLKFKHSQNFTPYVDLNIQGDWNGVGGTGNNGLNIENHLGYASDVNMVVNLGGALGDSSWLDDTDPPMLSFHSAQDFFAPYKQGMVNVPTASGFNPVVEVTGSYNAIKKANKIGINNVIANSSISNVYTTRAENISFNTDKIKGIYTWDTPAPDQTKPYFVNNDPYNWWDSNDPNAPAQTPSPNDPAISRLYIDTIVGYAAPFIDEVMKSTTSGTGEVASADNLNSNENVLVYPNPAENRFSITATSEITHVEIYDLSGKQVFTSSRYKSGTGIETSSFESGVYLIKVKTSKSESVQKLILH